MCPSQPQARPGSPMPRSWPPVRPELRPLSRSPGAAGPVAFGDECCSLGHTPSGQEDRNAGKAVSHEELVHG